ncbi:hypothetical protein [Sphingobacterium griseoflavum]|uniref:Preprotein translocase subunit SecD n=1 Tax=Sphingobacterium griseoflavum TaxID=1474952 RepID=A0ABQ3HZK9_9SPHI|nr:hypothetical protein [Sphingobacterium griseoflavum]GHE35834.1 hypothetical protein GCM10017764_18950 [Sphingobacterium griseoflavum]
MVKYMLLVAIPLLHILQISAQDMPYMPHGEDWKNKISGQYGHLEGIALFEDGTFLLYGYATLVYGTYVREAAHLNFTTNKSDTLSVFAHCNPASLGKSTMVFSGFEESDNFVQFDDEQPKRVFNENANCFDSPFVYVSPIIPSMVKIFSVSDREDTKAYTWLFSNAQQEFNEFFFMHRPPKPEYEDFFGQFFKDEDGKLNIQLSNYGGEKGYKRAFDSVENEEWNEIVAIKQQVSQAYDYQGDYFVNAAYATFAEVDLSQYVYQESSNAYIKSNQEDYGAYGEQNRYNDDRVLRKLERISLSAGTAAALSEDNTLAGSLFYTTCEEPEKSYKSPQATMDRYDPVLPAPTTIPPVPITDKAEPRKASSR